MALTDKLSAIGSAIRAKTGGTELLTLDAMPTAIQSIEGGGSGADLPDDVLFGNYDMNYHFGYNNGKLYEMYEDRIVELAKNVLLTGNLNNMFDSSKMSKMSKQLCLNINRSTTTLDYMFNKYQSENINVKFNTTGKIRGMNHIFASCGKVKEIVFDIPLENIDMAYTSFNAINMFYECNHLEKIPDFWYGLNFTGVTTYYYAKWYDTFSGCWHLKNILGAFPDDAKYTSNMFYETFGRNQMIREFTFAVQEDGTPYVRNWTKQVIDVTSFNECPGTGRFKADKQITNDETYAQLKDDPEAWMADVNYRFYNHDSAVRTINSLPDTSAVGGNTIKFKGAAGAKTDGGAINTLTEEEIAVATAKGWTVTFI